MSKDRLSGIMSKLNNILKKISNIRDAHSKYEIKKRLHEKPKKYFWGNL